MRFPRCSSGWSGRKDIWWGNIVAAAEIATAPVGLRNDVKRYFSDMVKASKGQYDKGIIYNAGTEIATAFKKSCNDKERGDGDSSVARQGGRKKDKDNN